MGQEGKEENENGREMGKEGKEENGREMGQEEKEMEGKW